MLASSISYPNRPRHSDQGSDDDAELVHARDSRRRARHRPRRVIDWRGEICHFLDLSSESTDEDVLHALETVSDRLQEAASSTSEQASRKPPRFQVVNRIECRNLVGSNAMYLETPRLVESGPHGAHLTGSNEIRNLKAYLKQNKEVVSLVHRHFECCGKLSLERIHRHQRRAVAIEPSTLLTREYMEIISDGLRNALTQLSQVALQGVLHPKFEADGDEDEEMIPHPYLWWYHRRQEIETARRRLGHTARQMIELCHDYFQNRLQDVWSTVDGLLSRGSITAEYIEYLFLPGEIVVSKLKGSRVAQWESFCTSDWLMKNSANERSESLGLIDVTYWTFNGNFEKNRTSLSIGPVPSLDQTFDITQLLVHPVRFAPEQIRETLRQRGNMFWMCRRRNYVSYTRVFDDVTQNADLSRFMIDIAMYRELHKSISDAEGLHRDDLGPDVMSQDNPDLGDSFYMCLPTNIVGFHMGEKKWREVPSNDLEVDHFEDVHWNEQIFDFLVLPTHTKELILALVTNKINRDEHTDVIRGKGNGLFILLHGAPGTGKTLTAESVAEIARKPLYRITCGDIGTKAEEVEKYLESALYIGQSWDCVVLLDEADVFLEQRSSASLERNALVSVFLRVLEYFEGILILTTNRVGTFDEAFKSRIHLSLRYQNLDQRQRQLIWANFINRLESLGKTEGRSLIDAEGVRRHIDLLAQTPFNGREIRNAISTARQLALFRRQTLTYEHLEAVLREVREFGEYTKEINRGFTDEELARDTRLR
ncbi:ATPase, AAA-type, core [Metarhizium album ARSEF 1941]|uniref:ATPase, AAA-type, core n=1 Tax=Metarhizium album (strain ARSEF 1941) TaxID=1081103 RepID=A0A0B2WRZ7_METAS|nr:ATPase, AAA-type, core [Metarhizium album ARSEF 1941]KHN96247.1 ATPase, AAA-type, core [Metarhizium album ARSEF 1941]